MLLWLVLKLLILTTWLASAAPGLVKIQALKEWGVRIHTECGSHLSDDFDLDERGGTLKFKGHRLVLDRLFGGHQLLFAMLRNPGRPISVESLRGQRKSAHFVNFRTLVRLFRELDPEFDGFHVRPGAGYYYEPGPYDTDSYAPVTWNGITLDWLNGRVEFANGMGRPITPLAGEILRLLLVAKGGPVTFDQVYAAIYPGRNPADKQNAFRTLTREVPEWFGQVRLNVTVDTAAGTLTLVK